MHNNSSPPVETNSGQKGRNNNRNVGTSSDSIINRSNHTAQAQADSNRIQEAEGRAEGAQGATRSAELAPVLLPHRSRPTNDKDLPGRVVVDQAAQHKQQKRSNGGDRLRDPAGGGAASEVVVDMHTNNAAPAQQQGSSGKAGAKSGGNNQDGQEDGLQQIMDRTNTTNHARLSYPDDDDGSDNVNGNDLGIINKAKAKGKGNPLSLHEQTPLLPTTQASSTTDITTTAGSGADILPLSPPAFDRANRGLSSNQYDNDTNTNNNNHSNANANANNSNINNTNRIYHTSPIDTDSNGYHSNNIDRNNIRPQTCWKWPQWPFVTKASAMASSTTTTIAADNRQQIKTFGGLVNLCCLSLVGVVVLLLLLALLTPLVSQRVLDRAIAIDILQTDISNMDENGFDVHMQFSVSLDITNDGMLGATRLLQWSRSVMHIDPTTLYLSSAESSVGDEDDTPDTMAESIETESDRSVAADRILLRHPHYPYYPDHPHPLQLPLSAPHEDNYPILADQVGAKPKVHLARHEFEADITVAANLEVARVDGAIGIKADSKTVHDTVQSRNLAPNGTLAFFKVKSQSFAMADTVVLNIASRVTVADSKELAKFFQRTLTSEKVSLRVQGGLRTRIGDGWFVKLSLDKIIHMDGLEGIQNAKLASMALPKDHPKGGIVLEGVTVLNNPSKVISLSTGPIAFGVYLPGRLSQQLGYRIAELECTGLNLKAGQATHLKVSGRLLHLDDWVTGSRISSEDNDGRSGDSNDNDKQRLPSPSGKQIQLGQLLTRYIQGKDSVVKVQALYDAAMPSWLSAALVSTVLAMTFPGAPTSDFIKQIDMQQLDFHFPDPKEGGNEASGKAHLSGTLQSVLQLPENVTFPLSVTRMRPLARLETLEGVAFAGLTLTDYVATTSEQDNRQLVVKLEMENALFEVLEGRLPELQSFLNGSFVNDIVRVGIAGEAFAQVETGLGSFEIGPLVFATITEQKGLGRLTSVPPILENMDVVDSAIDSLTIRATLVLWNPSTISAALGDLSFFWAFNNWTIGMATVPDLMLTPGNNTVQCFGMMNPDLDCRRRPWDIDCDPELARNASREFISRYISGDNSTAIQILGHEKSTKIAFLKPMMSSFEIVTPLPTLDQEFLVSATMYLLSSSLVLELQNPLDTEITVLYVNGSATYKDEILGRILVDFEHDIASPKPILIPANDHQNETSGLVKTPRLPVQFDLSSVGYEALKRALGGSIEVDVICQIKAKVGLMVIWLDYTKEGVEARVRKGF